ncbi:MAG TPA: pitrilysin family protein [Bacteroidota bacterium]|nr:pitrilysin family protein [Bacteroidota bacterium]
MTTMHSISRRPVSAVLCFAVFVICALPVCAQKADRTKPPALGPTPSIKMNAIQKFTLKNGLRVIVYEKHEVPIVQMRLVVNTGNVDEPSDKPGLAGLTANMLDEGAGGKSSLELADAIDYLGTSISTYGGIQSSSISMRSTVSKLDPSLKLFADVALRPDFPVSELERLQKQYLTSLLQAYDQPRSIASAASGPLVFGKDHPYGRNIMGTEQSIRSMTASDVKKFYQTHYRPNNAFLVIVGDVTAKEILKKIDGAFGAWKKQDVAHVTVSRAPQVSGRKIYLIDKPEAAQSVIRICRVGTDRKTEDYFPLMVMNTILGGSFSSRLNNNLREVHHYTYGANSGFSLRRSAGAFVAGSDVQTDSTEKAMNEFMKELKGISEPVTDEELARAKNFLALGYPDNFSNVASIAEQLEDLVTYDLPENYFNTYIARVLAVTKEDVQRAARKYVDADNLAIIIVGDRSKIEKGLTDAKIGTIVPMTAIDVLGPMPKL